ncbi:MAG: ATP-binding protein [Pseudomonadota bacterium]
MNDEQERDIRRGMRAIRKDAARRISAVVLSFIISILLSGAPSVLALLCLYLLSEAGIYLVERRSAALMTWRAACGWLALVEVASFTFALQAVFIAQVGDTPSLRLSYFIVAGTILHVISVKSVSLYLGLTSLITPAIGFAALCIYEYDGSTAWVALTTGLILVLGYTAATNMSVARTHRMLHTARRRADAASEAKGRFLAAMSHEIRTPLNAIIGLAEVIETRAPCAEDKEDARMVRTSGEHLKHMLDDVLDHAKLSAGEMTFAQVPHDLGGLVRDVAGLFAARVDQKGLALAVDVDPRLPGRVLGDPTRIRQIVTNLMSNAIKFTDAGGITLHVRWSEETGRVRVRVRDTGCGIDAAGQAALFSDFAQVDSNRERSATGTGLGLAISRNLAQGMGGDLTVKSTLGKGSTFTLSLPAKRAPQAGPAASEDAIADLTGWTVLVVDDSRTNRIVVRRLLGPTGATLIEACDGREAIDLIGAGEHQIDLVLLDMNMPVMDGPQFVQALNLQQSFVLRPKIVLLTANSTEVARSAFAPGTLDDYAAKPLTRGSLLDTLAKLGLAGPKPSPRKI